MGRAGYLCLLLPCLLAPAARAERFKYRFRPGQVIESRASMAGASIVGPGGGNLMRMQFKATIRQTQRIRSVNGGVVTMDVVDVPTGGTMTAMGRTEPYKRETSRSIVKMTERGRFISRTEQGKGEEGGEPDGMEGADVLFGLNFPDRDLKPGDRWEHTFELGGDGESRKVHMACRYVGKETVKGRSCARIAATISMPVEFGAGEEGAPAGAAPSARGKLTGTTTTYFDPAAGVEVYSSGALTITARADMSGVSPEAGEFVTVTKINVVQYLVKDGARKR